MSPNDEIQDDLTSSTSDENLEEELDTTDTSEDLADAAPGKRSVARINELLSKNKELEGKLTELEEKMAPPPPPASPTTPLTPEVQKAVDYLKNIGFVDKEELDQRVQAVENRALLNSDHLRLETQYSGEDGRPKYNSKEVEDFMRKRGLYDPEVAYKVLHEDELLDWTLKRAENNRKSRPYTERSGVARVAREDNTITREKIAEWMKTPEGRMQYERNRDKIIKLMQEGQL